MNILKILKILKNMQKLKKMKKGGIRTESIRRFSKG